MQKDEKIRNLLAGLGFLGIIVVFLLIVFSGSSKDGQGIKVEKNDPTKPVATLSTTKIDWGKINVNDTKESEVELKNEGISPLEINRMSTSCGCTGVKVIYPDGKETKEYSMHKSSEKVVVESKASVKVKIIYRPFTMPVEGAVTRQVFLETNDTVNPKLTIDASAVVNK